MPRGEGRRLHHTKSRLGCKKCKVRKVKCDEIKPVCSNCTKYDSICEYTDAPLAAGPFASPSSASDVQTRQTASPKAAVPAEGHTLRSKKSLLELQLMHHYTYLTSQNPFMANHDEGIRDINIRLAPKLALKHECLMNALLALAALHMSKLEPENPEFADAHRRYFAATLTDQRQAVTSINADNADALCLAASFINVQALAMRPETQGYSPPSAWLDAATGHMALFQTAWTWLHESKQILAIVNAEPDIHSFRQKCSGEYPDTFPQHLDSIASAVLSFQDPSEQLDSEQTSVYKWSMSYVGHTLKYMESGEDPSKVRRLMMAFGATAPPTFKRLVREHQSRALVILAYIFALMKAVDDVWWLRGIPEREVFGIQSVLPERWQWAMAWPIQRFAVYAGAAITPREALGANESD